MTPTLSNPLTDGAYEPGTALPAPSIFPKPDHIYAPGEAPQLSSGSLPSLTNPEFVYKAGTAPLNNDDRITGGIRTGTAQ